jgi:tRNA pseudouridine synthase 10
MAKEQVQQEEYLRQRYGAGGSRALKAALVEAIGAALAESRPGLRLVREKPEVLLLVDTLTLNVEVEIRPVFFYGRYRKLVRDLPQTRWPCRACRGRGKGCNSCAGSGLQYPNSVQDMIGKPLRELLDAEDTSFHGMGREDIDVRCLGRGRPFVIELKNPIRRNLDVEQAIELVNSSTDAQVEISDLRPSNRSEVVRIKQTQAEKSYTLRFKIEGEFDADGLEDNLQNLNGVTLEQRTPRRVSHRRADKVRKRKVLELVVKKIEEDEVELIVRCESGTYVKELVHSDEGRTTPSVAELIGAPCVVLSLDVEDVHAD